VACFLPFSFAQKITLGDVHFGASVKIDLGISSDPPFNNDLKIFPSRIAVFFQELFQKSKINSFQRRLVKNLLLRMAMKNQLTPAAFLLEDKMITMEELANYLRISRRTAHRLAARGQIPGKKVLGQWRFSFNEVTRWFKSDNAGVTIPR